MIIGCLLLTLPFCGTAITLVLVILRAVGVVEWAWWIVTAPLWGSLVLAMILLLAFVAFWMAAGTLFRKKLERLEGGKEREG